MKWASIISVVILALALAAETFFLVNQINDQQQLTSRAIGLQYQLDQLKSEKDSLRTEIDRLRAENSAAATKNEGLSEKVTALEQETSTLTEENATLSEDLEEKSVQIRTLSNKNNAMETRFMCEDTLSNIDFSSNESVNVALENYVNKTKGRSEDVSASYWNLIWTGKKYSTHTVEVHSEKDRMNYIWKFTVYFRGESYGNHENGIFYNDDQCWLYLDQ